MNKSYSKYKGFFYHIVIYGISKDYISYNPEGNLLYY